MKNLDFVIFPFSPFFLAALQGKKVKRGKRQNPYMNFMMNDYTDNPNKSPALPVYNEEVKKNVDKEVFKNFKNLDPRLFKDLGDMMEYDNFSRNFHTMPNTTNPNDQGAFAKFCYGDMKSCKEDTLECYKMLDECNTVTFTFKICYFMIISNMLQLGHRFPV